MTQRKTTDAAVENKRRERAAGPAAQPEAETGSPETVTARVAADIEETATAVDIASEAVEHETTHEMARRVMQRIERQAEPKPAEPIKAADDTAQQAIAEAANTTRGGNPFAELSHRFEGVAEAQWRAQAALVSGWQDVLSEVGAFANRTLEAGRSYTQDLASARSPQDLVGLQGRFLNDRIGDGLQLNARLGQLWAETARQALTQGGRAS